MRNLFFVTSCLLLSCPSICLAINFVQISQNSSMTVYIDTDSILKDGVYVTANEIREYKIPMKFDKDRSYRSSLGVAEIDCKGNTCRIVFFDTFELNGLKGKRLTHGVQAPTVFQIKPNTMTADVRDFLCTKETPRKT